MATGPDHYCIAEKLISLANEIDTDGLTDTGVIADTLSAAQVHATLALAAATARHGERAGASAYGYGLPD